MTNTRDLPEVAARHVRDRRFRLLIDGDLRDASDGGTTTTVDPSTGRDVTTVPLATPADVATAVEAAEAAGPAWVELGVRGRTEIFRQMAAVVIEHREELAMLDAVDSGNPVDAMRTDVDISVRNILDWPGLALGVNGQTIPASRHGLHYTLHEPYGVVARIVAFNHPAMFAMTRILAALIMGNTVVLKPGAQTPLSALAFGEMIRDVVPPGVVNIVTGDARTGDALTTHPRIKRIGFTGSVPTGLLIQQRAATAGVKHVSLELGGKNAMIVFPDVDLDAVVSSARTGMNLEACQGQSCGSTSRIFVHRRLYDEFIERYTASLEDIQVGPAWDEDSHMGPLVSSDHYQRVTGYVGKGKEEGARLVSGGGRPATTSADGYFLAPTIFSDVDMGMTIAREEIFGPVVSLFPWDDYDDVIRQANAVEYGLTASVWTDNLHVAHQTAARLQAGYVWINDATAHYWGTPFGGYKNSGTGREESVEELLSYCEQKTVHTMLRDPHDALPAG